MTNHHATWTRIIKMGRAHFFDNEGVTFAFTRQAFNVEEVVAYSVNQDAADEEPVVLEAARGVKRLHVDLCVEL
jgi:hypothetical protein